MISTGYRATIERELPTDEAGDLLALTDDLVRRELLPRVDKAEEAADFPRDVFTLLGQAGLLGLPYPEQYGGGGQPATVYLQVVEELARGWLAVGLGTSVHVLACHGVANFGTDAQREQWLPEMIGGDQLGAFCLSEAHAGSDVGAMRTTARPTAGGYQISGDKAWITHAPVADFYLVMARTDGGSATSDATVRPTGARRHIGAFHVPAGLPGIDAGAPERKMGLRSSVTSQLHFTSVAVPEDNLLGERGDGLKIAFTALDGGRLGMAACAVGVAQAALDTALAYAAEREAFGRHIVDFQGVGFLLADAAAGIAGARQLYLHAAARKDQGKPYSTEAAMAKLVATDMAMKVTTDMVQVLGGAGYVQDYPVERFMREAKVLQIVEGANQIQRMVITRALTKQLAAR